MDKHKWFGIFGAVMFGFALSEILTPDGSAPSTSAIHMPMQAPDPGWGRPLSVEEALDSYSQADSDMTVLCDWDLKVGIKDGFPYIQMDVPGLETGIEMPVAIPIAHDGILAHRDYIEARGGRIAMPELAAIADLVPGGCDSEIAWRARCQTLGNC